MSLDLVFYQQKDLIEALDGVQELLLMFPPPKRAYTPVNEALSPENLPWAYY